MPRPSPSSQFLVANKSDSYIFAIEHNSIQIPLARPNPNPTNVADFYNEFCQNGTGRELLILPSPESGGRRPLTAQQLEAYRNDPKWRRIRWFWYSAFWFGWLFALLFAILLTYSHPKCLPSSREWWKDSIIYEIWTLSFADSDGDGVGDLNGVRSRLEDLRRMGVGAILARPVFRVEHSGIGVINFRELNPKIGTMDDFRAMVDAAHRKGIRVLLDLPLAVTSISHVWFRRSALAALPENSGFADFYRWRRRPFGFSNWTSDFLSAYEHSTLHYMHVKRRPDLPILRLKCANVTRALRATLSFWIARGVDGFHFGSVDYVQRSADGRSTDWAETMPLLRSLGTHAREQWRIKRGGSDEKIFLFTSHEHLLESVKARLVEEGGLDAVVNTELRKLALANRVCSNSSASVAACANEIIADLLLFQQQKYPGKTLGFFPKKPKRANEIIADLLLFQQQKYPARVWPLWSLGSAFTARLASRVDGKQYAELLQLLQLALPGTPMVYYGDELGLRNAPCTKYPQRGQMPWKRSDEHEFDEEHVVMCTNRTGTNATFFASHNFRDELRDSGSFLHNFRRLARLRQRPKAMAEGRAYITKTVDGEEAFALCRYLLTDGEEHEVEGDAIVVAVNFGPLPHPVSLSDLPPFHRRYRYLWGQVVARSSNARLSIGESIDLGQRSILLGPEQGVVIQATP